MIHLFEKLGTLPLLEKRIKQDLSRIGKKTKAEFRALSERVLVQYCGLGAILKQVDHAGQGLFVESMDKLPVHSTPSLLVQK